MEKGEKFVVADGPFMLFDAVVVEVVRRETRGEIPEILGMVEGYQCDVDVFGKMTRAFIKASDAPMSRESLAMRLNGLRVIELKTLRAMINGKLGKRSISPEQQAKMQQARKKS